MVRGIAKQKIAVAVVAVLLLCATGCSDGSGPPDPDVGRSSLTAALDAWKGGGNPSELRQRQPPIYVGEPLWDQGRKLVKYEVEPSGITGTKSLQIPVTLTLQLPGKKTEQKRVYYIIATEPKITVFAATPE